MPDPFHFCLDGAVDPISNMTGVALLLLDVSVLKVDRGQTFTVGVF
jgi:hypothetical protein